MYASSCKDLQQQIITIMKKQLLTLATALCLGVGVFTVSAEPITKTITEDLNWDQDSRPFAASSPYGISQQIFPAPLLERQGVTGDITVQQISFPLLPTASLPTSGTMDLKVFMVLTDATNLDSSVPVADFTQVASMAVDFSTYTLSTNELIIPLDDNFVIPAGKGIVIGVEKAGAVPYFKFQDADAYTSIAMNTWFENSDTELSFAAGFSNPAKTKYVPGLKLTYVEGTGEGPEEPVTPGVETKTVTVCEDAYGTKLIPFSTNFAYSASQAIYPAEKLSEKTGTNGTITVTSISFPVKPGTSLPSSGTAALMVYMAGSDTNNLNSKLAASDFTKVATAQIDFSNYDVASGAITVELDDYFVLAEGKNLVIGIEHQGILESAIEFQEAMCGMTSNTNSWSVRNENSAMTLDDVDYKSGYVPGLVLTFAEGEVTKPVDPQPGGETKTVTIGEAAGQSMWEPFSTGAAFSGTQILYTAERMNAAVENAESYTIDEIQLLLNLESFKPTGVGKVEIMMMPTTLTSLPEAQAFEGFTTVYNGDADFDAAVAAGGVLPFKLETPFEMKKDQGLIVMYRAEKGTAGGYAMFRQTGSDPEYRTMTWRFSGTVALTEPSQLTTDKSYTAVMNMVYTTGGGSTEPQKVVDLAVTDFYKDFADNVAMYVNKPYSFGVTVANNGEEATNAYTVEIINTADNTVLASSSDNSTIFNGMPTDVWMDVTFSEPGTYNLAARVVIEGDQNADNNVSGNMEVTVEALAYKAVSVAGNSAPEAGVEETYTVTVANEGEGELTGYTVELYVNNGMDKLVATANEVPAIAAGETATVEFKYTFELAGKYGMTAVVNVAGGEPSTTPVLEVEVPVAGKYEPVINETIVAWDGETFDFAGTVFNRNVKEATSQVLYKAELFGEHTQAYQIQSLTFTAKQEEYPSQPHPLKIYLAQTDQTEEYVKNTDGQGNELNGTIANLVPFADFTLVYDGVLPGFEVTTESFDFTFDLQKLFTLESGKSLVMFAEIEGTEGAPYLQLATDTSLGNYAACASMMAGGNIFTGNVYASNNVPVLKIGYALEPLPAEVNVAATEIVASTETVVAETETSFRVRFENKGTVDAETFTIELLSIGANDEATVLQSYENARTLATGATGNQVVAYTFTEAGTYKVAARVVIEGDTDETDNMTAPVEVVVSEKTGLENLIAEGTLSYDAAARALKVNVGAATVTVSDLAGRVVAAYNVEGAAVLPVELSNGVYVVKAGAKTLKVRI